MIIHSIIPDEILYAGIEDVEAPVEMHVQGILMQVERISNDQIKVVRVISPELEPYMNNAYLPGQIIRL